MTLCLRLCYLYWYCLLRWACSYYSCISLLMAARMRQFTYYIRGVSTFLIVNLHKNWYSLKFLSIFIVFICKYSWMKLVIKSPKSETYVRASWVAYNWFIFIYLTCTYTSYITSRDISLSSPLTISWSILTVSCLIEGPIKLGLLL